MGRSECEQTAKSIIDGAADCRASSRVTPLNNLTAATVFLLNHSAMLLDLDTANQHQ